MNTEQPQSKKRSSIVMWTHGQSVVPYLDPDTSASSLDDARHLEIHGRREGWGTEFHSLGDETVERWFQVPIPTTTQINGAQFHLDEFTLLFRSDYDSCFVGQLDLWDGPLRLDWTTARLDPPLSGDFTAPIRDKAKTNCWVPRVDGKAPAIQYGLNISVMVLFQPGSSIVFCAAGARFISS